jgi:hypothetical protein
MTLEVFIRENREAIIDRCRTKVAGRVNPAPTQTELDRGVPLFLDQLVVELRDGPSTSQAIGRSATLHGRDLLFQGLTVGQVVHDYGDICQSVTDLAVERGAPISTDDFRTLNRCLDDAIAGAVTEFSHQQGIQRVGESHEMQVLIDSTIAAFEVLQEGSVGVAGSTGSLVHRNLVAIRALVSRQVH